MYSEFRDRYKDVADTSKEVRTYKTNLIRTEIVTTKVTIVWTSRNVSVNRVKNTSEEILTHMEKSRANWNYENSGDRYFGRPLQVERVVSEAMEEETLGHISSNLFVAGDDSYSAYTFEGLRGIDIPAVCLKCKDGKYLVIPKN